MKYIVELTDLDAKSCRIQLTLPFAKKKTYPGNSNWRVLDEGFFKYRTGGCNIISPGNKAGFTLERMDLHLVFGNEDNTLIVFKEFIDIYTIVNDSGSGDAYQYNCVNFTSGYFGWVLLE